MFKEYEEKGFDPNIGTVYGQIYSLTEKSLGSRKVVRDFKQQNEPNFKCTLCGVREPVHPGTYNGQSCPEHFGALKGFWQDTVMPTFPQIRKSERLCGVCVTKRLAAPAFFRGQLKFNISNSFPSISMVATASFKEKVIKNLLNPELKMRVDEFVGILHTLFGGKEDRMNGEALRMVWGMCNNPETVTAENKEVAQKFASVEGDWLYEDSFVESLKEEIPTYTKDLCSAARIALRQLLKAAKKLCIDPPSKYYAVLLMHGDNMGKWLSGEIAPKIEDILHPSVRNSLDVSWNELKRMERPLNPSLHLAMSKALRDFSLKVAREIVEKDHLGKLVYAGGDDVLAFVNLKDLPEVMRKLRAYFSGSLKSDVETNRVAIDFKDGSGFIPVDNEGYPLNVDKHERHIKGFMLSMGTKATASMGIVIAHHSSNLSQVLDEVRACEKQAKKLDGKNAFCIALAKRAGGTEHVSSKWYYENISLLEKGRVGVIFETIPLLRDWADAFYNEHISPKFVYTFRTETKGLEYKDSNGKIIQLPAEAIRLELQRIAKRQTKSNHNDKVKDLIDGLMRLQSGGLTIDDIGKFLVVAAFLGREGNR
ncbi:MAG: type III-B CRISPR-associated protein Cas10/Cmr2 [Nitrospirae bacterium]|nr:type III-B CRISPR-associated protein Cas10/Cmr2 [Nitrospirota bacterium]